MTKSKPSQETPKISDPWLDEEGGFEEMSPETVITCRFDLYHDGDWKQAIKAAILALEHDLPFPEWAGAEVVAELRRAIKLEPLPPNRPKGRASPPRKYIDEKNQIALVAAVDAAAEFGLRGDTKFQVAMDILNREGVRVSTPASVETTYKKHRNKWRKDNTYPRMLLMFSQAICESFEQ